MMICFRRCSFRALVEMCSNYPESCYRDQICTRQQTILSMIGPCRHSRVQSRPMVRTHIECTKTRPAGEQTNQFFGIQINERRAAEINDALGRLA